MDVNTIISLADRIYIAGTLAPILSDTFEWNIKNLVEFKLHLYIPFPTTQMHTCNFQKNKTRLVLVFYAHKKCMFRHTFGKKEDYQTFLLVRSIFDYEYS